SMRAKKRRRRRGGGKDPLGTHPRDRLRLLLLGALATLGATLALQLLGLGAAGLGDPNLLVLSASLCVALLGAVAALGVLPEREPLEGLGGTGAALLTVAAVGVAAFGLG